MGVTFSYIATTSSSKVACQTDQECYKANTSLSITEASNDAEKKLRCCQFIGYHTAASGTDAQKAAAATMIKDFSNSYGMPIATGWNTKFCNNNYPATIPIKGTTESGTIYHKDSGLLSYPKSMGAWANS